MTEWQPIDTAPKGVEVLVYGRLKDGSGSYQQVCRYYKTHKHGYKWSVEWMDNCLAPTHWMPLPEPPKQTS